MSNARNIASIAGEDVLNASNEIVPVYACRAWVNFDGALAMSVGSSYGPDAPPADFSSPNPIRDSGNVSSLYDDGTGIYTVNFTTAMPDANCAGLVSANVNNSNTDVRRTQRLVSINQNQIKVCTGINQNSDSKEDFAFVTIAVFR